MLSQEKIDEETLTQEITSLMSAFSCTDVMEDEIMNPNSKIAESQHPSGLESHGKEEGANANANANEEVKHLMVTKSKTRYSDDKKKKDPCPNCYSAEVELQAGCYVCLCCFSLLDSTFDSGGEWRSYQNDSTTAGNPRCSVQVNPFLPETSSHTFMKSSETGDRYAQRFQQLSNWMVPHHEKSLNSRLHDIAYFGSLCNLPGNVVEFTKQIYVEFIELQPIYKKKKSSRGDCHNAIVAVILLVACKEYGVRRSPDDICNSISISTSDFTKAANLVFSVLQHSHLLDIGHHQYIVNSGDYINSFCRTLGISKQEIIDQIYSIETKVHELKILTKNTPQAIACGCIYFVTKMRGIDVNRHDFETKCSVSLPTLNKVYENLTQYTDQLI